MQVTVLMCVHSQSDANDQFFVEAAQSLLAQTYTNFSIVCVLDECWNQTRLITQNLFGDLNALIIEKSKKQGLAYAKNCGLSCVTTPWVAFLDADDYYLPTKLEKQIEYVQNNDVDFLGTHTHVTYGRDKTLYPSCFDVNSNITHDQIKEKIFKENVMTHGSMLIKMDALKSLNFYQHVKGAEDWDLWKRAISTGYKFFQLPERLYIYSMGTSVAR